MKVTISLVLAIFVLLPVPSNALDDVKREMPAGAQAILDHFEQFDLYSLEPEPTKEQLKGKPTLLHGWLVLGKTTIKEAKTRTSLLKTIPKRSGGGAKCFDPRHAIHATHGGKTVDLLICFECGWVYIYEGEKHTATVGMGRSGKKIQPAFDKVLTEAKVPLANKRAGD